MGDPHDPLIGQRLGPDDSIIVLKRIGRGASGSIFLGQDEIHGVLVALKFLSPEFATNPTSVKRFLREGTEFARLRHPNLVSVFGWGAKDERLYLISEFVEGKNLYELLQAEGPQAPEDGLRICRGVAAGLQMAHDAGVVHRDLKPENIMIRDQDRHVLILDFGIAKDLRASLDLTSMGMYIGTPAYSAPEQVRGERVDHRADIFSLGVILYELLTGKVAFDGRHSSEVLRATLKKEPTPITNVAKQVTLPVAQLIGRMIMKRPSDRFTDMRELIAEVDQILARMPDSLDKDGSFSFRRRLKDWFQ
ncbi:MAG TPA: serine/threonine-protein kinase [Planctomycetota bacterium]|jgi:serine/threonine-protein kinase|nr:serine/threonine-protein kinase [Planctomycetota bacterium]